MAHVLVGIEYIGCFADNEGGNRDLKIATAALTASDRQISLDDCRSQCAGYQYMGLQSTSQCYCGNSYGSQGTAECPDDCGLSSSGAGCGGRNAVYQVSGFPDEAGHEIIMQHHQASCIAADASVISAAHSLFAKNDGGDVIFARSTSTVDVAHRTCEKNSANATVGQWHSHDGGATISLWEASVATLNEVSFIENTGVAAGAILVTGESTVAIDRGLFSGNTASATEAAGAAIFANQRAQVRSSQTSFDGNSASAQLSAGVIYAGIGVEISLTDATLSNNQAVSTLFGAGAIYADESYGSLVRSSVETNTATGGTALTASNYADALYVRSPLKIFIQDSTFNPLIWGGKTVSIVPRIVNPGAQRFA
jgi:hypothetical protein